MGLSACGGGNDNPPATGGGTPPPPPPPPPVTALPGVIPAAQGAVTNLGTFDGFTMLWSGAANLANSLNQWTGIIANPTSNFTGIAAWSDGAAMGNPGNGTFSTIIGTNRVAASTDTLTGNLSDAGSVSLDGQLYAAMGMILPAQEEDQSFGVKQPATPNTAASFAGVYNIIAFQRTPGASNTTSTVYGTLTINANGTWSVTGNFTPLTTPVTPATPFTDNGTFTVDAAGTANVVSAITPTDVSKSVLSADGNYLVMTTQSPTQRFTNFILGFKQHANAVSMANSNYVNYRVAPSETTPTTGILGEIGFNTADAAGILTDTADSKADNGVVCGIPGQANCNILAGTPGPAFTPGTNGTLTSTSNGITMHGMASFNNNVIVMEEAGAGMDVLIKK